MSSTQTTPSPQPPTNSPSSSGSGGGGPTSSPLLFFVALGFGVVFTNLWIIVGVKYCFRYNQRNRAARAAADGEPIDLTAMPRPHRRRREKKLMSMDEVNERFPLTKYKQWKAGRENQGLPAAGGINTAPPSRANSVKDVEGVIPPARGDGTSSPRPETALSARDDESRNDDTTDSPKTPVQVEGKEDKNEKSPNLTRVETSATSYYQTPKEPERFEDGVEDSDDDDPIRTATAPELLGEPGDTCAICIDTLEDDEDVRGLTCGHAFHASCVDPWLTSRRACCPLCKADYYVPKQRPEGEATDPPAGAARRTTGLRSPTSPPATWSGGNPFSRSRVVDVPDASQSTNSSRNGASYGLQGVFSRQSRRDRNAAADGSQQDEPAGSAPSWRTRLASARPSGPVFSSWFGRNRGTDTATDAPAQPTPAQLEAGNR